MQGVNQRASYQSIIDPFEGKQWFWRLVEGETESRPRQSSGKISRSLGGEFLQGPAEAREARNMFELPLAFVVVG